MITKKPRKPHGGIQSDMMTLTRCGIASPWSPPTGQLAAVVPAVPIRPQRPQPGCRTVASEQARLQRIIDAPHLKKEMAAVQRADTPTPVSDRRHTMNSDHPLKLSAVRHVATHAMGGLDCSTGIVARAVPDSGIAAGASPNLRSLVQPAT